MRQAGCRLCRKAELRAQLDVVTDKINGLQEKKDLFDGSQVSKSSLGIDVP